MLLFKEKRAPLLKIALKLMHMSCFTEMAYHKGEIRNCGTKFDKLLDFLSYIYEIRIPRISEAELADYNLRQLLHKMQCIYVLKLRTTANSAFYSWL